MNCSTLSGLWKQIAVHKSFFVYFLDINIYLEELDNMVLSDVLVG